MQTKAYAIALLALLAATVLQAWSIWTPTWIRTSTPPSSPIHYTARYGLTQRCEKAYIDLPASLDSSADARQGGWKCRSFPLGEKDCHDDPRFCVAWRGASYAAQMSLAFLVVSILGLLMILLLNGRQRKRDGWKVISGCSSLALTLQAITIGVVANLLNSDDRFYAGSKLGSAFVVGVSSLSLVSFTLVGLVAGGIQSHRNGNGTEGDGYLPVN